METKLMVQTKLYYEYNQSSTYILISIINIPTET